MSWLAWLEPTIPILIIIGFNTGIGFIVIATNDDTGDET